MGEPPFPVEHQNGISTVKLADCILRKMSPEQIGPSLVKHIDKQDDPKLILSFENVEHLSSASLGMLLMIKNNIDQHGGQLRLCHLNQRIRDLFDLTMLTKRFDLHATVEAALTSFESEAS